MTRAKRYFEHDAILDQARKFGPRTPLPDHAGIMRITPALARDWLARNKSNRPVRIELLVQLEREIREGRWAVNGEPIIFSSDGELLDGQHRLLACVMADAAIESYVIPNVEPSAFVTIDTGRARGASDLLGLRNFPHTVALAAAIRWHILYELGRLKGTTGGTKTIGAALSNAEILAVAQANPALVNSARYLYQHRPLIRLFGSPSLAIFLHWRILSANRTVGSAFLHGLEDGLGLTNDSPMYILRERLIKEMSEIRRAPTVYRLAWAVKAWNASLTGTAVKRLTYDPPKEDFPRFYDPSEPTPQAAIKTATSPIRRYKETRATV